MIDQPTKQMIEELNQWITSRWRTKTMPKNTLNQWYKELLRYDSALVWQAVHRHATDQFPPRLPDVIRTIKQINHADGHSPSKATVDDVPTGPSMKAWMARHGWASLVEGARGWPDHVTPCDVCDEFGVKPMNPVPVMGCPSGLDHVWGSVDILDLSDDGLITVWCANCGAERRQPATLRTTR